MKTPLCVGVTAAALLAGISVAAAAQTGSMMKAGQESLNLTATQQRDIYQDVSKLKTEQTSVRFTPKLGEVVPTSIKLRSLPASATKQVPAVKSYEYAMLGKKVFLVQPDTKKIADIITS
jgi:Protein of unknown function (DUF1236)